MVGYATITRRVLAFAEGRGAECVSWTGVERRGMAGMSRIWTIVGMIMMTAERLVTRLSRRRRIPYARAQKELDKRDRVLREEHPDTTALRHLAHYRRETGDMPGAVEASEQLLAEQVRALGEDHPHVLTTRHNLANLRGEAGDAPGAAQALEQLVADMLRVHGPDHPYTGSAQRNLVHWREKAEGESPSAE